jgi:hypothetical protein
MALLLIADQIANAEGFGVSREGDSTIVTVNLNNARDSAWVRFAYGEGAFYDSVLASPLSGTSNTNLKSTKLDLDSIGGHYVEILTFTSDAVAETVVGTHQHQTNFYTDVTDIKGYLDTEITRLLTMGVLDSTLLDSVYKSVGWPGISHAIATLHMKQGDYSGAAGSNIEDDLDALTGGGTEPETVIVLSVGDTTQIQGAVVVVRTLDQSTVKVPGLTTDVNGKLILELGDGVGTDSFFVATSHNNYIYKTDTIAVASGGGTDTVWMTQFSPNSPTDTGKVTLYVWTDDILGDTLEGATFAVTPITKSKNWRTDGGRVILPQTVTKATDSLGYARINTRTAPLRPIPIP